MDLSGLLLQITRKCPLECSHCYVSSSPREKDVLDTDLGIKAIREYGLIPDSSKNLCITGGDPFSCISTLERLVEFATENDFFVHVNTSAFFGNSKEAALKVLSRVSKISQLEVSIDREHLEFVASEKITNAVSAAVQLGIPVQIAVQNRDKENDLVKYLFSKFSGLTLYVQNFAPVGDRNTEKHDHPDLMEKSTVIGCDKVGSIFIDENGTIFPCTSAVVASMARKTEVIESFSIGNIKNTSLVNAVKKLNCIRLRLVKEVGPSNINNFLGNQRIYESYCHECVALAQTKKLESDSSLTSALEWIIDA